MISFKIEEGIERIQEKRMRRGKSGESGYKHRAQCEALKGKNVDFLAFHKNGVRKFLSMSGRRETFRI